MLNIFRGCSSLTSVVIPNSVTTIGSSAFQDCSSLTSVVIPNSVTTIRDWAFEGCSSLTSITIPNSVTSISRGVFFGCSRLSSVVIPNSVTTIEKKAFAYCTGLTSIYIPESITSIGEDAFSDCKNLKFLSIPSHLTAKQIGNGAFEDFFRVLQSVPKYLLDLAANNSADLIKEDLIKETVRIGLSYELVEGYRGKDPHYIFDKNGNVVYSIWDESKHIKGRIRYDEHYKSYYVEESGKMGAIDASGNWIIPLSAGYSDVDCWSNCIIVKKAGNVGVLDKSGKWIIPLSAGYSDVRPRHETYYAVKKQNTGWRLITPDGRDVLGAEYDEIWSEGPGIKIEKGKYCSIVTTSGKTIIPFSREYTSIDYDYSKKIYEVSKNYGEYKGTCNEAGRELSMHSTKTPSPDSNSKTTKDNNALEELKALKALMDVFNTGVESNSNLSEEQKKKLKFGK